MPKTKKKKVSTQVKVEKKVEKMSEQMNMLLGVFGIAMIMLAYVMYKVYVAQ